MDIVKLQMEAIKTVFKRGGRVGYYVDGDTVYLSTDSATVMALPEKAFYLNLRRNPQQLLIDVVNNFKLGVKYPAVLTGKTQYNDSRNYEGEVIGTIIEYETEDYRIWFAEKRLKRFGKPGEFKIVGGKSCYAPAGIYDRDGNFLGLIAPIRVKEE